jgi:hypothetical protein
MVDGVRENDRSLMSEYSRIGYKEKDLAGLNIVRQYRNLLHVFDISKFDGTTLDKFVTSDVVERSIHHTFPCEEPTVSDFQL